MITEKEALKLLEKYNISETIVNHCIWVSEIAYELATRILAKNSEFDINPTKVKIAWLLHDIWKAKPGIHELNTQEILESENLLEIAKISLHWFLYEYFKSKWIDDSKYLPLSIENKIVVLSDMYYNQNKQRVSLDERFDDIMLRYKDDLNFIEIVKIAKLRMEKLESEIFNLL